MDKEAMIERIKKMAAKPSGNKDVDKTLKFAIRHPDRILAIDDDFNFDNDICVTLCNGNCCTGKMEVIVTPPEIDELFKIPGMKTVDRAKFVEQNFETLLGSRSLVPVSIIKFKGDVEHKKCPFLLVGDKFLVATTNTGEIIDILKTSQGLCVFPREYKPVVCRLFPLARIGAFTTGERTTAIDGDTIFICSSCPAIKTNKKTNIREFTKGYNEISLKKARYLSEMSSIVDELKKTVKNHDVLQQILEMFLSVLFYADGETADKINKFKEIIANGKRFLGL